MPAALGQACNDGPDRRSGNGAHYSVLARGWQPLIDQEVTEQAREALQNRSYLSFRRFSTWFKRRASWSSCLKRTALRRHKPLSIAPVPEE